jgi:hypothetical protein
MRKKLVPQRVVLLLIAAAVVLLVGGFATLGLGELLAALDDAEVGGRVAKWIALAFGVLFVIDLVCLVLAQGLNSLSENDDSPEEE